MSLGNKLIALGQWFEKHFPEKMTAAEVNLRFQKLSVTVETAMEYIGRLHDKQNEAVNRLTELERLAETFNSDINKTKVMLLTQRQTR